MRSDHGGPEQTAADITVIVLAFACAVSALATILQPSLLLTITTIVLAATLVAERPL